VQQARAAIAELSRLGQHVEALPLPKAQVAIMLDWQAILANSYPTEFTAGGITEIQKHLLAIYTHFLRRGINVDVIVPDRDLAPYRLVVLPGNAVMLKSDALAGRLGDFVRGGGTMLTTATVFSKDEFNNYYTSPRPQGLTDLLGLSVGEPRQMSEGGTGIWDRPSKLPTLTLERLPGRSFQTYGWMEEILPTTAQTLGAYADGAFEATPAVTVNSFGQGKAMYVGTIAQADLLDVLLDEACGLSAVTGRLLPPDVEYVDCSPYHFFLNSSAASRVVDSAPPGEVLVGKCQGGKVELDPYGVCWIKG
jgi:beta-galactosidase